MFSVDSRAPVTREDYLHFTPLEGLGDPSAGNTFQMSTLVFT